MSYLGNSGKKLYYISYIIYLVDWISYEISPKEYLAP